MESVIRTITPELLGELMEKHGGEETNASKEDLIHIRDILNQRVMYGSIYQREAAIFLLSGNDTYLKASFLHGLLVGLALQVRFDELNKLEELGRL